MQGQKLHADSMDITPEELVEAIKMYQESKAGTEGGAPGIIPAPEKEGKAVGAEPEAVAEPPAADMPKKNDGGVQPLIAAVEELLAALKAGGKAGGNGGGNGCKADGAAVVSGGNSDGSENRSKSLNADSADDIMRQRLSICRIGDRLHMYGLEEMSVSDGKRAVIAKVLPDLRLDGRDEAYVDAAYDLAVCEVNKRKGVAYQKMQMEGTPARRADSFGDVPMAALARQRMIEREGGKE